MNDNGILTLKSASLTDPATKSEDYETLYNKKGIDHQSAFIYEFYFLVDGEKTRFKIDDISNITDERYYVLLQNINALAKQPSFKTVFEYHEFMNKRKAEINKK
jgi:hypothetical protein